MAIKTEREFRYLLEFWRQELSMTLGSVAVWTAELSPDEDYVNNREHCEVSAVNATCIAHDSVKQQWVVRVVCFVDADITTGGQISGWLLTLTVSAHWSPPTNMKEIDKHLIEKRQLRPDLDLARQLIPGHIWRAGSDLLLSLIIVWGLSST